MNGNMIRGKRAAATTLTEQAASAGTAACFAAVQIVVEVLRENRRQQLELRMALGMGRLPEDAPVFPGAAQRRLPEPPGVLQGMGARSDQHRLSRADLPCLATHPCLAAD